MNRKALYRDIEKFRVTRNKQKRRYYGKTQIYKRSFWSSSDDELVLAHSMPDTALSAIVGHSVAAIQSRRCLLKKLENEEKA